MNEHHLGFDAVTVVDKTRVRTYQGEYELISNMVTLANVEQLLDALMSRASTFPHRNDLVERLKTVAEKIVAECVAAKLTEPVFPLPKHDDIVDAFGKTQYQSAAQLAAAARQAHINGSVTSGVQFSAQDIQRMKDQFMKSGDLDVKHPLLFNPSVLGGIKVLRDVDFGVIEVDSRYDVP
jgi:hypothetical protein